MPIYGKDTPTEPPVLEVGGTSALDSRYHVTFSDTPDLSTEVDRLGLLLSDSGGRLAFNVQHSSPFGGMLGGGGSPTDRDLSRYTVRSQSDWRAGRGLLTSYEDTLRFHDSEADTRFPGKIMLPPAKVPVTVTTSDAPQNVQDPAVTSAAGRLYARWDANGLAANALTAYSTHVPVPGSLTLQNIAPQTETLTISTSRFAAQSFTPDISVSVTELRLYIAKFPSLDNVNLTIRIRAGSVTGAVVANGLVTQTVTPPSNGTVQEVSFGFSPAVELTAATTYVFTVAANSNACLLALSAGVYEYGSAQLYLSGAWYPMDSEIRFIINDGAAATSGAKTRRKLGQPFTMGGAGLSLTSIRLYLSQSAWGPDAATVKIFNDSSGSPGVTAHSTGTLSDPGSSAGWTNIPMTTFSLVAGTTYWVVLEVDSSSLAENTTVEWGGTVYTTDPTQYAKTATEASGVFASWAASTSRLYFKLNNLTTSAVPYWTPYSSRTRTLAQSFTAPALALNATKIQIFAKRVAWNGSPTLTLGLYTGASEPTTSVATGSAISASTFAAVISAGGWVTLPITYTLVGGTKYWIVLTPTAPEEGDSVDIEWYMAASATYAGEALRQDAANFVIAAWASSGSYDRYFKVNNGTGGATAVTIAPLRFEGKWYVAAGIEVLRFNTSTSLFDQVASLAQVVTALESFNGNIYAAQGDATQVQMSPSGDSGSWTAVAGGGATHAFTHLRAYNGYLYCAKSTGGEGALDYTNGTDWNSGTLGVGQIITVGTSDIALTGIVGLQNEIFITAATGIYSLSSSFVYQTIDYSNEQYQDNGKNALTWMADGRMYVPVAQSLHAYDGSRLTPVGLDLDDGLPVGEQGRISAMVGSRNFLFAAVDAGTSGKSGVYAFNGVGWHCLAKATATGARIRSIGLEQITSSSARPRLWYWEDGNPYYMEFPDLTDLPSGYASSRYDLLGFVESCWMGGELSQIPKDFTSIIVRSTGVVAGTTQIAVWAEIDRSGVLFPVGNITQSPHQELEMLAATFDPTTTAAGSTTQIINTVDAGSIRISPGEFVRIEEEVGQVASIIDKSSFSLVLPLAEAPAAGVTIYPARPSGREIRYRLELESYDQTATPVVNRVSLKWGELILDKRRITMTVRIEDGMKLRGSNAIAYPYSASQLRTKLREWMRRTSPFYLTDPTGDQYQVKIIAANEASFAESNSSIGTMWSSRLSMTLDEL